MKNTALASPAASLSGIAWPRWPCRPGAGRQRCLPIACRRPKRSSAERRARWPRSRAAGRPPAVRASRRAVQPGTYLSARQSLRYARQPVSTDRPDVFNSVALSIGRSPLDARWSQRCRAPASAALPPPSPPRCAAMALSPSSKRSTATSTRASASSTTASSSASPTAGWRRRETLAAAAAIARIMRSPSAACCARAGFADRDLYLVVLQGSHPPRRPCRAGRPRRRPLPGARQWHRPDRSIPTTSTIIGRS